MKRMIVTLTVGAVALSAGAAMAGHHGDNEKMSHEEHMAKMEAKLEEKFAKVDANGDGVVTSAEYMAYKTAEAEKDWAKWVEGDADGAITLEEAKVKHAAHMAEKHARHKEMMKEKSGE